MKRKTGLIDLRILWRYDLDRKGGVVHGYWLQNKRSSNECQLYARTGCRGSGREPPDNIKLGERSFPKLKILINPTLTFAQPIQPEGWITRKGGMRPVEGEHTAFSCGGFQRGLPPFGTLLCLQSVVCYTCWRG